MNTINTMNGYFVAAAVSIFLLGLVHSVLGEKLIFRHLRQGSHLIPTNGGNLLREHQIRILWASWHLVTIFGWGIGAILLRLSWLASAPVSTEVFAPVFAITALAGAACVFIGTRAKHPGWIVLLAIAVCAWLGGS